MCSEGVALRGRGRRGRKLRIWDEWYCYYTTDDEQQKLRRCKALLFFPFLTHHRFICPSVFLVRLFFRFFSFCSAGQAATQFHTHMSPSCRPIRREAPTTGCWRKKNTKEQTFVHTVPVKHLWRNYNQIRIILEIQEALLILTFFRYNLISPIFLHLAGEML